MLSTATSEVTYDGNGATTAFPTTFRFLEAEDLEVFLTVDGSTEGQVLTTDFTVSGEGEDAGGTVTMLVAPPADSELLIRRRVALTQELVLSAQGPYPPQSIEDGLDKLMMAIQQLDRGATDASNEIYAAIAAVVAGAVPSQQTPQEIATAAMTNSWVTAAPGSLSRVAYWKDSFGVVHWMGAISGGTPGAGSTLLSTPLPAGYRPLTSLYLPIVSVDNGTGVLTPGYAIFGSNGQVTIFKGQAAPDGIVFLDGVSYLAEA